MPNKKNFFPIMFPSGKQPTVMGINGDDIAMKLMLCVPEGYRIEETLAAIILHFSNM